MENDCNCPCHQEAFEDDQSKHSDSLDSGVMEGMCPYYMCSWECCGYFDDCNCPCHQDILEALCHAERVADPLTAEIEVLEGNSTKEENSSDDQSN